MNKYICFKDYNDYELIYLIREGNESALDFFFEKYEKYIKKIIISYVFYDDDRIEDLLQEGRMTLFECLNSYDDSNASFFTYFSVALKRRIAKYLQNDFQNKHVLCEDSMIDYISRRPFKSLKGKYYFSDKIKISIFDDCIIGNQSLMDFSRENNISYNKVYYLYQQMLEELKDIF